MRGNREILLPMSESDREWLREYLVGMCKIPDSVTQYRVLYTEGVGTEIELHGCVDAEAFHVSYEDDLDHWVYELQHSGFPRHMFDC